MTANDYSFEPASAPLVEAVPTDPSHETHCDDDESDSPSDTAIMVGCGLLGWVVAGPFLAILAALGGKYAADKNRGPIGDASRTVGRIAAAAGQKAREEHLGCKLKASIASLFRKRD
eukprot:156682_1